jgi:cell division protease FtsH
MVMEWGMSEKLGFISFGAEDEPIFLGKEIAQHKEYSEETAKQIDSEIGKILEDCMTETENLLSENKKQLEIIANALVEEETLDDDRIRVLLDLPPAVKYDEEI